jgi:hypothetical protein
MSCSRALNFIEATQRHRPVAVRQPERCPVTTKYAGKVNAPDFPAGMDWLNTESPVSLSQLRGKLVVLDFWTYC